MLWPEENVRVEVQNPVLTSAIKKSRNTELFIERTAAFILRMAGSRIRNVKERATFNILKDKRKKKGSSEEGKMLSPKNR